MATDHFAKAFELVPERRIASLYDLAILYAACDLYDKLTSDIVDWDISPRALQSMTPLEKEDLLDAEKDNSFIAVQVDLTDDEPKLGDPPVTIENYTKETMYQVGYMKRDGKAGKKMDYSIVNHANGKPIEEIAYDDDYGQYSKVANRFLRGRLERWPFSDAADEVIANGHDESGIIQSLRMLGNDTEKMAIVEQAFLDKAAFDKTEAMVGVKMKFDEKGDYLYPGEVPVLNTVALQNRYNHIQDGLSVNDAFGEGVGFVTGESGTVLGGSTGILNQYHKKQVSPFPDLIASSCWQTRPLREPQAIAVSNFGSIIDQFYYPINDARMYYLPYPREPMTIDLFKRFHNEVYDSLLSADDTIASLERILTGVRDSDRNEQDSGSQALEAALADLEEEGQTASAYEIFEQEDAWLNVYGLYYVASTDPERTYVDEPSISLRALAELSDESDRVVEMLGGTSLFGTLISNMDQLSRGQTPRRILQGRFFNGTTAKSPDEDETRADNFSATADDVLFAQEAKLLRGKPIAPGPLLEDYVRYIVKKQRANMGEDNNDSFPKWAVVEQYAQLLALENAELLQSDKVLSHGLANMSTMNLDKNYDSRDGRLQDFLSSHNALKTAEARAVFLTGGLVARVTATQHEKQVSTKMVDQHPVSSVTKRSLQRIVHQTIEKNTTYEQMDDRGQLNRRYTDRLPGVMLQSEPQGWNLTETEVKWLYALGTAYGKQDSSLDPDPDTDAAESEVTEKSD